MTFWTVPYKNSQKLMFSFGKKTTNQAVKPYEFGTITDGEIYLFRSCYRNHTYTHKKKDKFPGEESVSFSAFVIENADLFGFDTMKLDIYTRTRKHMQVDISVEDWRELACPRKFKAYEMQSDVLVSDLFNHLVNRWKNR